MPSIKPLVHYALCGLAGWTTVVAQLPPVARQSTDFNSSFALTESQIASAELTSEQAENIKNIVNFDRSQLANGGPYEDDFYTVPPLPGNGSRALAPGTLLKSQPFTDPIPFSIPPSTALSRILYTTTLLNGTVVPASAFVLWPFRPRPVASPNATQAPVVVWAHGTSGWFPSQAPSAARNLWYGDMGPFALALAGFAVVAPDYAGLGVGAAAPDAARVLHQYLVSPAGARDALNALRAARAAFAARLAEDFVVMGHSQGGGVAWAVAELLAARANGTSAGGEAEDFADLLPGYRGALPMSPTTEALPAGPSQDFWGFLISLSGAASILPNFTAADWLTPVGEARARLMSEVEGGIMVAQQLLDQPLLRAGWNTTASARAYGAAANAGRKPFRGPLLVAQGTADAYVDYATTAATVAATCDGVGGDLEFAVLDGVGHGPALDAARPYWLAWIDARFARAPLARPGCVRTEFQSFLPSEQHLSRFTSFPQWAGAPEYGYQMPVGN